MIIEDTVKTLKGADIARLHQTFFGSADTPAATEFLQHLDQVQTAIGQGTRFSGAYDVPLNEIPPDFKITPSLARECRQYGIGITYEGVDRQGHLSGADMERMCEDPNVCAKDPKHGNNMIGRLSEMTSQAPITTVLGDTLSLQMAGNRTAKIPVELSDRAKAAISARTPADSEISRRATSSPALAARQ